MVADKPPAPDLSKLADYGFRSIRLGTQRNIEFCTIDGDNLWLILRNNMLPPAKSIMVRLNEFSVKSITACKLNPDNPGLSCDMRPLTTVENILFAAPAIQDPDQRIHLDEGFIKWLRDVVFEMTLMHKLSTPRFLFNVQGFTPESLTQLQADPVVKEYVHITDDREFKKGVAADDSPHM